MIRGISNTWITFRKGNALTKSSQAILSTIFFDYGEMKISTSRQWWIFPVTVVPLTVVVFSIWVIWLKRRQHRDMVVAYNEGQEVQNG